MTSLELSLTGRTSCFTAKLYLKFCSHENSTSNIKIKDSSVGRNNE